MNPVRKGLTNVSRKLGEMDMVVDKLLFRNHVDKWCKDKCNPYDWIGLEGVSDLLMLLFYKSLLFYCSLI